MMNMGFGGFVSRVVKGVADAVGKSTGAKIVLASAASAITAGYVAVKYKDVENDRKSARYIEHMVKQDAIATALEKEVKAANDRTDYAMELLSKASENIDLSEGGAHEEKDD